MKPFILAALTITLLLSGCGPTPSVHNDQKPSAPLMKTVLTAHPRTNCQALENQLSKLQQYLEKSRVYLNDEGLDAQGKAAVIAARKSWQRQMSQVGGGLTACPKVRNSRPVAL